MTVASNLRVHIAPVGYEFRRVTEPLIRMQADKVYLVTYAKYDTVSNFLAEIEKEIANKYAHIQIIKMSLDIWDLYACIEKFHEIISKEEENHVYVNVSTGTKITAIAGMLACMMWNAQPYYVPVSYPIKEVKKVLTEHVEEPKLFPTYEIKQPKQEFMSILNLLQKNKGVMRKVKIIEKLEDSKIVRRTDEKGNDLSSPAKHSQLRALLDPMEKEWNLITVKASGRRSEVSITAQGETALKIFGTGRHTKDEKLV